MDAIRDRLRSDATTDFELPTANEKRALVFWIVLSPLALTYLLITTPFDRTTFVGYGIWKRALMTLAIPFIMPPAYFAVLWMDLIAPMIKRWRNRRAMLRHAGRQIEELK